MIRPKDCKCRQFAECLPCMEAKREKRERQQRPTREARRFGILRGRLRSR